jgi:hypothetical protein
MWRAAAWRAVSNPVGQGAEQHKLEQLTPCAGSCGEVAAAQRLPAADAPPGLALGSVWGAAAEGAGEPDVGPG